MSKKYNPSDALVLLDDFPDDTSSTDEESIYDGENDEVALDINNLDDLENSQDYLSTSTSINAPQNECILEYEEISCQSDSQRKRLWKKAPATTPSSQFVAYEVPKEEMFTSCHLPADFVLKYLDSDIRESILFQSNLYMNQKQRSVPPMSLEELYGFLGVNIIMGYHRLPSWTYYWKSDQDVTVPFVSTTMPRNRFAQLLSNLHVNDNSMIPSDNKDKLYKLRPLITKLNDNYMRLYSCSKIFSIDESMILFKGRHSIKQYNPMKPIKRGYKLWERADANGYVSKLDIYQGKDACVDERYPGFGLGEKVVLSLTEDIIGNFHEVYFDNYFTSVNLLESLKGKHVLACGTIRTNRKGLPQNMASDKSLERGEFDWRVSNDELTFFKWKDNKSVHLLSNFHGTETTTISRTQRSGEKKTFSSPKAIKDYNNYMSGVDKADMLCSLYSTGRKSKKWWHRIFFGLLDRTLANAYIAYCKLSCDGCSWLNFRRSVAQTFVTLARKPRAKRSLQLLSQNVLPTKRRGSSYSVDASIRLRNRGIHWPVFEEKRGRCEVCSTKGIESRPHCKCFMCGVFLCCNAAKNCFSEYHNIF